MTKWLPLWLPTKPWPSFFTLDSLGFTRQNFPQSPLQGNAGFHCFDWDSWVEHNIPSFDLPGFFTDPASHRPAPSQIVSCLFYPPTTPTSYLHTVSMLTMPIHLPHPPPDLIFDTEIQSLHSVIASAVRCSQNKGPSACWFGENASLLGCYSTLISVLSFQLSFNKVMMQKASLPRCPFFRHFMKWSQGSLHVAKQIVTNRVKRHSTFGHNHPIFHLPAFSISPCGCSF